MNYAVYLNFFSIIILITFDALGSYSEPLENPPSSQVSQQLEAPPQTPPVSEVPTQAGNVMNDLKFIVRKNFNDSIAQNDRTLITVKYAEDLYFVLESSSNPLLRDFAEAQHKRGMWQAYSIITGTQATSGIQTFKDRLPTSTYIVYASSHPVTSEDLDRRDLSHMVNTIEMAMTVSTRSYVPFSFHMGISRMPGYVVGLDPDQALKEFYANKDTVSERNKKKRHRRISPLLHAFAAKCMEILFPGEKKFIVSTPTKEMLNILTRSLNPGEYFLYDNLASLKNAFEIKNLKRPYQAAQEYEEKRSLLSGLIWEIPKLTIDESAKQKVMDYIRGEADKFSRMAEKEKGETKTRNKKKRGELSQIDDYIDDYRTPIHKIILQYKHYGFNKYGKELFEAEDMYLFLPEELRFSRDESNAVIVDSPRGQELIEQAIVGRWEPLGPGERRPYYGTTVFPKDRDILKFGRKQDVVEAVSQYLTQKINIGTLIAIPTDLLARQFKK